jgi:CubicO group peptidase (beta-lactamase class C family)
MDDDHLRAFFDTLIPRQLADHHIPGAVVTVVKDVRIVYAQGYGSADIATQVPVVAELTLVNIGSCGKLGTWTAVMQLVEQGKLDPQADVNTYLDFPIPATYPAPITLAHLLTHTARFERARYSSDIVG